MTVCYESRVMFLCTWKASDTGYSLPQYGWVALCSFLPMFLVLMHFLESLFDYQQPRRTP